MGSPAKFVLPDCRDATAYARTMTLTRLGWAWEFLRRNATFREDLTFVSSQVERVDHSPVVITARPTTMLQRWGVVFRRLIS